MAVIENFLKKQLDDAISITPDSSSMKFNIHKECSDLKDMIEKQMLEEGSHSILKEKLYYLNNIMTEWRNLPEKNNLCSPKNNLCSPKTLHLAKDLQERLKKIKKDLQDSDNKLQEKLRKIKKDLPDSTKEKSDSVSVVTEPHLEIYRWSCRSVGPEKIYGVEDKAMIVERLLVKEGFKAVGFVGMAGVGKTALCQKVFNTQQVKKHFHPRIWVCLSKQPNDVDYRRELVMMMLMCLGFEKNIIDKVGGGQGGLNRLILALRRQLNRKRYLIVLDDVGNMDKDFNKSCSKLAQDDKKEDFNKFCSKLAQDDKKEDRLAYGLPKGHGGAVIVTSRSPILMESMVGKKNFHSLPLADKRSCWKIFEDAVNKDAGEAVNKDAGEAVAPIEDILKNEIVKECAGLPLIAKMLGKIGIKPSKRAENETSEPSSGRNTSARGLEI